MTWTWILQIWEATDQTAIQLSSILESISLTKNGRGFRESSSALFLPYNVQYDVTSRHVYVQRWRHNLHDSRMKSEADFGCCLSLVVFVKNDLSVRLHFARPETSAKTKTNNKMQFQFSKHDIHVRKRNRCLVFLPEFRHFADFWSEVCLNDWTHLFFDECCHLNDELLLRNARKRRLHWNI